VPPGPLEIAAPDESKSDAKDAKENSEAGAGGGAGAGAGTAVGVGVSTRTNSRNRISAPIASAIGCLPFSRSFS
jgi:hypothetical protein